MDLSILCITKAQPHCWPFLAHLSEVAAGLDAELVVMADGPAACRAVQERELRPQVLSMASSSGYVESILELGVRLCRRRYVLRMDDDERCSPAMVAWMEAREHEARDHWKFCTANLWRDERSVPVNPPLWPDHHTRLSVREKSGGRTHPHAGSPYGGGELAPVIHEHHKFLVKDLATRIALAEHYERLGALLPAFTLPERCYERLTLAPLGDGTVRPWADAELETVEIGVPA